MPDEQDARGHAVFVACRHGSPLEKLGTTYDETTEVMSLRVAK